jgi:hypothetical protein
VAVAAYDYSAAADRNDHHAAAVGHLWDV